VIEGKLSEYRAVRLPDLIKHRDLTAVAPPAFATRHPTGLPKPPRSPSERYGTLSGVLIFSGYMDGSPCERYGAASVGGLSLAGWVGLNCAVGQGAGAV
jgi:hypothetical protein